MVRWVNSSAPNPYSPTKRRDYPPAADTFVPLRSLGHIRAGASVGPTPTSVKEINFNDIPSRLKVTRADMKRIAVIEDGLGVITKIEREFLRPIIKGPESLESAFAVK